MMREVFEEAEAMGDSQGQQVSEAFSLSLSNDVAHSTRSRSTQNTSQLCAVTVSSTSGSASARTENERAALELSAPGGAYTAAVHVESSASVDTSTMNPVQHVQVIDRDRDRPVALSTVTRDATDNQQVVPQSSSEPAELTDRFVEEQVLEATRRLRAELYENELAHQRDRQKCREEAANAEDAVRDLQGQLSFCTQRLSSGANERAELIDQLSKSTEENAQLQARLDLLNTEWRGRLREQGREHIEETSRLEEEVARLKVLLSSAISDAETARAEASNWGQLFLDEQRTEETSSTRPTAEKTTCLPEASPSSLEKCPQYLELADTQQQLEPPSTNPDAHAEVKTGNHVAAPVIPVSAVGTGQTPTMASVANEFVGALTQALRGGRSDERSDGTAEMRHLAARQSSVSTKLPFFSGQADEWPLFLSVYRASTEQCGFTNAENAQRLQASLKGPARDAVRLMLSIPDNVETVISTLERRFGRPELVIADLVTKARSMKPLRTEDLNGLMEFTTAVNNIVMTMRLLNSTGHMTNPSLRQELVDKLPTSLKVQWGEFLRGQGQHHDMLSLEALAQWLTERADAASLVAPAKPPAKTGSALHAAPTNQQHSQSQRPDRSQQTCQKCRGNHNISDCSKFRALPMKKRWDLVYLLDLCSCCFRPGHWKTECRAKGCTKCPGKHHPLLHQDRPAPQDRAASQPRNNAEQVQKRTSAAPSATGATHTTQASENEGVSFMTISVILQHKDRKVSALALLDPGSSLSFVRQEVAEKLGATRSGIQRQLSVAVLGGKTVETRQHQVQLLLKSQDGSFTTAIRPWTQIDVTAPLAISNTDDLQQRYSHLQGIPFQAAGAGQIDLLIGLDAITAHQVMEEVPGAPGEPIARRLPLGWVCLGPVGSSLRQPSNQTLHMMQSTEQVPGILNPADLATRGLKADELASSSKWWHGPEFLTQSIETWPVTKLAGQPELPGLLKKTKPLGASFVVVPEFRLHPTNYASWQRLVRVTAWCQRFIRAIRTRPGDDMRGRVASIASNGTFTVREVKVTVPELSVTEVNMAERVWLATAQREAYPEAVKRLRAGKTLLPSDSLQKLTPGLDTSAEPALLVIDGRLKLAAHLPAGARMPVILPPRHRVTELVIQHEDAQCHHDVGPHHLLANLRERYWIVHGLSTVKATRRHCIKCQRKIAKPAEQVMGLMPNVRTIGSLKPFTHSGVDFAGPFYTRQGRGRVQLKRYLCLFTCLETRACHLEMAFSLDTESFLMAFSRFVKRRGTPSTMASDNGTNFTAAERELREAVRELDTAKISRDGVHQAIQWRFQPPRSPHFGGVFESMVKSAKRALTSVLSKSQLSDEELMTAFAEAEHILNSRPLTTMSNDPADDTVLTPNHFIVGRMDAPIAKERLAMESGVIHPRRRWETVQGLVNNVWRRWVKEFVSLLNLRRKWRQQKESVKVDDVVLCVLSDTPRNHWPLGRIVEVFPGPDNEVRVVNVLCRGKVKRRSIQQLIPLPVTTANGGSTEQ